MNTKNNKRRRESIALIEKTFIELLQTRELSEISICDICKRCGLNRSTFYANYADIYELADRIKEELEKEVLDLYRDGRGWYVDGHDYLRLFRHIKDNQLFYKTYFKLGYDEQHPVKLYDVALASQEFHNQHIAYHIEFFRGGFNAIVKLWLAGGCRETPEEMDEIIRSEYRGRSGRLG